MLTRRTALITALLLASTFALFFNADFLSRYAGSPLAVPLGPGEGQGGVPQRPQLPGGQGGAVVNPDGGAVAVSDDKGGGGLAVVNDDKKEGGGDGGLGGGNDGGLGGLNGDGGMGGSDSKETANAFPEVPSGNGDNKGTANAAFPEAPPGNTDGKETANTPPVILPDTSSSNPNTSAAPSGTEGSPGLVYFAQAFSDKSPAPYDFAALKAQCSRTQWREDDVYLQCTGMAAGLTSIMSQVKVCLKMAFEAGTGLVLPSMPLRDSDHLKEFNFMNQDAYMTYDEWFDAAHLIDSVARVCPQMRIVHPSQLDTPEYPVGHKWHIKLEDAPGYKQFQSYFWTGRPFATFFDQQYTRLTQLDTLNPNSDKKEGAKSGGMTVVSMTSNFLLFRVTDDPTGQDLRLWNDLSHLIRFTQPTRELVAALLGHIKRPFYGVHFRVEADTIWSSLEHQLKVDLDALDKAWEMFGTPGGDKPLVYLACGDQEQVKKFVEAGSARGWEVTHKWTLAAGDDATLSKIDALPFDFQGAVDMGFMVRSDFFLGITGSAFSSTIGNARDATGRYRGSSLLLKEGDGGARTHLFNDGDASHYACCL